MLKRSVDFIVVLLLSPFWLPLLLTLSMIVYFSMGGAVFFTQLRGGLNNQSFKLYKLRTMTNARDSQGELLPDVDRITRLGQFLRDSSLDELPSLLNLLKGEISLVGPRPFIADYLPLYNAEQRRRHAVRPGITGWAQINGRNAISWEEKFELDIWYVDNQSLWLDLKILTMTLRSVIIRENINKNEQQTMERFNPSSKH